MQYAEFIFFVYIFTQVFNIFCEDNEDGSVLTPLRIDIEETERVAYEICFSVGIQVQKPHIAARRFSCSDGSFLLDFSEFISLIGERIGQNEAAEVVEQGISEVYNLVVGDVVKKVSTNCIVLLDHSLTINLCFYQY